MRLSHLLATTAAAVLLTTSLVQAQQKTPDATRTQPGAQAPSAAPGAATGSSLGAGVLHEISDSKAMVQSLSINAKDLGDTDIYSSDGKKIGEVNKVLADSTNSVRAVTVDVGGFLGMGAKEVVFPVDKLQKGKEAKRLQTTMTKAEIEKLDEYRRDAAPRNTTSPAAPRADPDAPRTNPSNK